MEYLIYDIKYLCVSLIFITLYIVFDRKTKKILLIDLIMIAAMVLISGYRCNFGSDMYNYYVQYNRINHIYYSFYDTFSNNYQSAFSSLCYIVYNLTHFEYAIFWVVALITYPTMVIYMRKHTEKPSVAFSLYILMGFFVMSNNILKQNIAMVLLIIGYFSFLKKNKWIGYILIVFLASKFHITAIIGGIAIFVSTKIKPSYKNLFLYIVIGISISIFYNIIIPLAVTKISIFNRYARYFTLNRSSITILRGAINTISYIVMYTILSCILLKNKEKIKKMNIEGNYAYEQISFIFIAIMISIIAINNQTLNRVSLYLYQFIVFSLPSIFSIKFERKTKQIYLTGILVLIMVWFGINNIAGAENRYFSYSTYLKDEPKSYY